GAASRARRPTPRYWSSSGKPSSGILAGVRRHFPDCETTSPGEDQVMSSEGNDLREQDGRFLGRLAYRLCRQHRLRRRFDEADVVQETLLKAHLKRGQFRGTTEAERLSWLGAILRNTFRDMVARELSQKRNPGREQSLHTPTPECSAGWGALLAAGQPSPG